MFWSLRYQDSSAKPNNYWSHAPREQLNKLIDHLSNAESAERVKLREILDRRKPGSILDVGCGPATELSGYEKHGLNINYTGLDGSEVMLKVARKRHPTARFVKGNAQNLEFPNSSFNAVLLKHILEHLPSYESAVSEAVRVASEMVLIDFFQRPIPLSPWDMKIKNCKGYWENWYGERKFENFLSTCQVRGFRKHFVRRERGQTDVIYEIDKK